MTFRASPTFPQPCLGVSSVCVLLIKGLSPSSLCSINYLFLYLSFFPSISYKSHLPKTHLWLSPAHCMEPAVRGHFPRPLSDLLPQDAGSPWSWERESESEVAQSCLTLCAPMDCSLPSFSVHGILQARILEWVAISFSSRAGEILA